MELKAPKNLYNSFGKYKYRNAEGICEAVKPFLKKYNVVLTLQDDVICIGERIYIKATAKLSDCESSEYFTAEALARESAEKKGMDDSQITGTASSYARKYALNGLFLLDDTKDADTDEFGTITGKGQPARAKETTSRGSKKNTKPEPTAPALTFLLISMSGMCLPSAGLWVSDSACAVEMTLMMLDMIMNHAMA